MPRRALSLAATIVLAGSVLPGAAADGGLDRLTLRDERLGWEAVGRLDLGSHGFCSGVLIAPTLVLTAAHCLEEAHAEGRVENLRFRAGFADGTSVAEARAARAVIHPDYRPGEGVTPENVAADVGLVQLAQAIPAATAAPFAIAPPPRAGTSVSVVSYGQGRTEAPSREAACTVSGRTETLVAFDCDVTFGSSGAPVFDLSAHPAKIVSLVSSGGTGIAFGMDLTGTVATLRRAFATGDGIFPATGFSSRRVGPGDRGSGAKFVRPSGS